MKIRFGLDIDIDMEDVEVEGNSIEDCKNKLFQMSVQEMLEAGGYVKNYTIDDVDYDYPEDYKYLSESEKELITEKYMEHIKYCKKELHDGLKMLDERFFDLWD